jgi:hypothetical protein
MKNNNRTIVLQSDAPSKSTGLNLTVVVITLALIGGGYFLYAKNQEKQKAQKAAGEVQSDEFTRMASLFRQYIAPQWWGTPERAKIIELAKTVTNWKKVVDAYALLYTGDNLETDVRKALVGIGEYDKFLVNLNAKGVPQNNNGTGTQKAVKPAGLTPNVSYIKLNTSTGIILGYKDRLNYGTGKYDISHAQNASLQPFLFIEAVEHQYINSNKPFSINLYKVKLPNGSMYWYRASDFVKQASAPALKALTGYNYGVKVA